MVINIDKLHDQLISRKYGKWLFFWGALFLIFSAVTGFLFYVYKSEQGVFAGIKVPEGSANYSYSFSVLNHVIQGYYLASIVCVFCLFVFLVHFILYVISIPNPASDVVSIEMKQSKSIQIIAWDGFNEKDFRQLLSQNSFGQIDILEYVRGINKVTHLRYNESKFDLLVADCEFLKRHYASGRNLEDCSPGKDPLYDSLWPKLNSSLTSKIHENISFNHMKLGIPIRLGMHDILANTSILKNFFSGNTNQLSYRDFKLTRIIECIRAGEASERSKIGLWNWYVPTMPTLLKLSLGNSVIAKELFKSYGDINFWEKNRDELTSALDDIVETIKRNKDCFCLVNDPKEVKDWFNSQRADGVSKPHNLLFLLGGGSFLLGKENCFDRISSIVPANDELLMFVECVSIISKRDNNDAQAPKQILSKLFEVDTHLQACNRNAYLCIPTTNEALSKLFNDVEFAKKPEYSALVNYARRFKVLDTFQDGSMGERKFANSVVHRQLPPNEFLWYVKNSWNKIESYLSES